MYLFNIKSHDKVFSNFETSLKLTIIKRLQAADIFKIIGKRDMQLLGSCQMQLTAGTSRKRKQLSSGRLYLTDKTHLHTTSKGLYHRLLCIQAFARKRKTNHLILIKKTRFMFIKEKNNT